MKKAKQLPATCEHIKTCTRRFSVIGPSLRRKKFKMVRLLASIIIPLLGWTVRLVKPRLARMCRVMVVNFDGGCSKTVLEGCSRLVFASYLGNLWRGQGTRPNNCGHERTKLNICGIKNKRSVLEK